MIDKMTKSIHNEFMSTNNKSETIGLIDESSDHKYFTIIPNYILNHSSSNAQSLYVQLKRLAGENGLAYPSMGYLAKQLSLSLPTVRSEMKYLLKKEWIVQVGYKTVKTAGGIQQLKAYKIVDIWQKNVDFYKGRKNTTTLPKNQRGEKIGLLRGEKIGLQRRLSKEEDLINTSIESNGSGIKSIGSLLTKFKLPTRQCGATFQWQDTAVRWWNKLGIQGKPTAGWFKLFKLNVAIAERACSFASDSNADNLEKLTYWAFNQYRKNGKITYEKK